MFDPSFEEASLARDTSCMAIDAFDKPWWQRAKHRQGTGGARRRSNCPEQTSFDKLGAPSTSARLFLSAQFSFSAASACLLIYLSCNFAA
jgi:hypothetical protein